jgi:flagellar motor switch protein FliN/FliY
MTPQDEGTTAVTRNPMELMMQVEVPVTVSLGRTRMFLKDLLGLSRGSVIELDQEIHDEVDIRVNNTLIARGEVVGVDGNFGVRIIRMVDPAGSSST